MKILSPVMVFADLYQEGDEEQLCKVIAAHSAERLAANGIVSLDGSEKFKDGEKAKATPSEPAAPEKDEPPKPSRAETMKALEAMTKTDLIGLARNNKVKLSGDELKADIVIAILDATC